MNVVLDYILYLLFRASIFLLNLAPLNARIFVIASIMRLITFVVPKYREIALLNLSLAYPGDTPEVLQHRLRILDASYTSLARIIVDMARLTTLDSAWIKDHVEFPQAKLYSDLCAKSPTGGVLGISGHLGSFELMARGMAILCKPIQFIGRPFKNKYIEQWWKAGRESTGSTLIPRTGGFRRCIRALKEGETVGVLFDQNVTRNQAFFIPWFGKSAATTTLGGYAAVSTRVPVAVFSMSYLGNDRYRINMNVCKVDDILNDSSRDEDEQALLITQRAVEIFERMILDQPEDWFWIHRRWKTTPQDGDESFYK